MPTKLQMAILGFLAFNFADAQAQQRSKNQTAPTVAGTGFITADGVGECECLDNAYTADGNVRYRCRIRVKNEQAPGNPKAFLTQNPSWALGSKSGPFWLPSGSITYPANGTVNGVTCGQLDLFNKPLGNNNTWNTCVEVTVPFGTPFIDGETFATFSAGSQPGDISDADTEGFRLTFPESCASQTCEEAPLDAAYNNINATTNQNGNTKIFISDFLTIAGNPSLQSLSAEIAYFKHVTPDECRTCVRDSKELAFFNQPAPGQLVNGTGWKNQSGNGAKPSDVTPNKLTWLPAPPAASAKLLPSGQKVNLQIDVPDTAWSPCCENTYQVCIRYTYTDDECDSCDTLICHDVSLSERAATDRDNASRPARTESQGTEIAPGIRLPPNGGRSSQIDSREFLRLANVSTVPMCKANNALTMGGAK